MEFLKYDGKPKRLRTRLYGDQRFSRFELEILHTPILQRLYNLKQLGYADRVFPDAIHARFNHVLGVTGVVEQMVWHLVKWLTNWPTETFAYAVPSVDGWTTSHITAHDLAELLENRMPSLRLMGLLHDLTHAAYGHTLEDEVSVFTQKHDNPERQTHFFDALTAQLIYLWCTEERLHRFDAAILEDLSQLHLSARRKREIEWTQELVARLNPEHRSLLANHLRELEFAFRLLQRIDFVHHAEQASIPDSPKLLISDLAGLVESSIVELPLVIHRDMFMVDIVGNTICADLLDYARRDADNAGLHVQYDDRFLRYLCVVSVEGGLSPTKQVCIRTAIQIFTDKMRYDVLSEMSGILKARYLLNERVLLHPTKCAAGAMLGTAVQLLGLRDLPSWMQVLGDQEFWRSLNLLSGDLEALCSAFANPSASSVETPWPERVKALWPANPKTTALIQNAIREVIPDATTKKSLSVDDLKTLLDRAQAARNVLWKLSSRRFPGLVYRLRNAHHTAGASDKTIAATYSKPDDRYLLERKVERLCNLPIGSIFVHCPTRKTSMKVAEALVVGAQLGLAAKLRDVTQVSPEGLEPYEREIKAIEDMYRSIWQFHAYLDASHWDKQPMVAWVLHEELGFPNDELLAKEFLKDADGPFHIIAGELRRQIPYARLPEIIARVDAEPVARMRGDSTQAMRDHLMTIIRSVLAEAHTGTQLNLDIDGKS